MMTDSEGKRRYKTLTPVGLCNWVHKIGLLTFVVIFSSLLKCGAAEDIPNESLNDNQTSRTSLSITTKPVNADLDTYLDRVEKLIGIAFAIISIVAIFVGWKTNCLSCQSNPEANPENCGRDNRNDRPIVHVNGDYNENVTNYNVTNNNNGTVAIPMEQFQLSQIGPSRSPLPLTN